jgi:uncharacterized protein YjbI with pentapeptide repeats
LQLRNKHQRNVETTQSGGLMAGFCAVAQRTAHFTAVLAVAAFSIGLVSLAGHLQADDKSVSLRQFVGQLYRAKPGSAPNFSGVDISGYDLTGLDFKRARLDGANLFGVDLTRANLKGTKLKGAVLNRAVVIRADFSGADLRQTLIMRPTVFSDLSLNRAEAPKFRNADLTGARLTGNLDGADFTGATLDGLNFEAHEPRSDISFFPRNFCRGCHFSGASLRRANLRDASFVMGQFQNCDLSGADLSKTDLSYADFTGADFTGADVTGANFDGAMLSGVRGLETVTGWALAENIDRTLR